MKVLELLQEEIEEQELKLSQMEAREEEERAERRQEEEMRMGKKTRQGSLARVVEQEVQEKLPGSTCSLPPDAGTCTTASLQR